MNRGIAWGLGGYLLYSDAGYGFFDLFFFSFLIVSRYTRGDLSCVPLYPEPEPPRSFAHNVHGLFGRLYSYTDPLLWDHRSFPSSAMAAIIPRSFGNHEVVEVNFASSLR